MTFNSHKFIYTTNTMFLSNQFADLPVKLPSFLFLLFYRSNKQKMNELRTTILAEQEVIASKRRFGLFSQPPPIGLGDDSQYLSKKAVKGEDGKPKTEPRGIYSFQSRTGVTKKSFIQVPSSIYQGDSFKDEFKRDIAYMNKIHCKGPMHEMDFKPASGTKSIMNAPYQHIQEKQHKQKQIKRDDNGRVKTEPAQIQTNPNSKVESRLFKHPTYMTDEYNRQDQISKQQHSTWKSKVIHEVMFKSLSHGGENFTKDKKQYGIDETTKSLMGQKKEHYYGNSKRVNHEAKFKLARRGFGEPIGRYPQYVPQRVKTESSHVGKLKTEKAEDEKEMWKPSSGNLTRPTPSISLMNTNMRKYC